MVELINQQENLVSNNEKQTIKEEYSCYQNYQQSNYDYSNQLAYNSYNGQYYYNQPSVVQQQHEMYNNSYINSTANNYQSNN